MRRSREDTAQTRRSIVETASRLFRGHGIASVSVADIMSALGLTVGGFYRHFDSKESLVAEAIEAASVEAMANLGVDNADLARASALVEGYLSKAHRDNAELGCPVAALCSQVPGESPATKAAFTRALSRLIEIFGIAFPGNAKEARDRRMFAVASVVGAVVLSRATSDAALANDLLRVARDSVLREATRQRRPRKA